MGSLGGVCSGLLLHLEICFGKAVPSVDARDLHFRKIHRIRESLELEGTHRDHRVQLLALHRQPKNPCASLGAVSELSRSSGSLGDVTIPRGAWAVPRIWSLELKLDRLGDKTQHQGALTSCHVPSSGNCHLRQLEILLFPCGQVLLSLRIISLISHPVGSRGARVQQHLLVLIAMRISHLKFKNLKDPLQPLLSTSIQENWRVVLGVLKGGRMLVTFLREGNEKWNHFQPRALEQSWWGGQSQLHLPGKHRVSSKFWSTSVPTSFFNSTSGCVTEQFWFKAGQIKVSVIWRLKATHLIGSKVQIKQPKWPSYFSSEPSLLFLG